MVTRGQVLKTGLAAAAASSLPLPVFARQRPLATSALSQARFVRSRKRTPT